MGVVEKPEYELEVMQLRKGDRVFVYSDGAIEQLGATGQQFGVARLMQELSGTRGASLQASIDLSLDAVLKSTADGKSDDDISMLAMEIEVG